MKLSTSTLLLGAASAAVANMDQQVLGGDDASSGDGSFESIKAAGESWMDMFGEKFSEITAEAKAVWDELALMAPDAVEAFKKNAIPTRPKPHSRRPDSQWDHVVKGADVQNIWIEKDGARRRQVGGRLENFNLRAKKVDPSKLGVDTVKQYSGYLDDEENDKHLFYCKLFVMPIRSVGLPRVPPSWKLTDFVSHKGSSSPETIPRTTLSSSG